MNLYEQQARNRRRTWLVMAAFAALVLLLGLGFDAASSAAEGILVPSNTIVAACLRRIPRCTNESTPCARWHSSDASLVCRQ